MAFANVIDSWLRIPEDADHGSGAMPIGIPGGW
jgi:hypothetical protein